MNNFSSFSSTYSRHLKINQNVLISISETFQNIRSKETKELLPGLVFWHRQRLVLCSSEKQSHYIIVKIFSSPFFAKKRSLHTIFITFFKSLIFFLLTLQDQNEVMFIKDFSELERDSIVVTSEGLKKYQNLPYRPKKVDHR